MGDITVTCAFCGDTFETDFTHEQAAAFYAKEFPEWSKSGAPTANVCEDCYNLLKERGKLSDRKDAMRNAIANDVAGAIQETIEAMEAAVALVGPINALWALSQAVLSLAVKSQKEGPTQAVSTATYVTIASTLEGMAKGLSSHVIWSNVEEGVIEVQAKPDGKVN